MKIKYVYNCEQCKNKSFCKHYDDSKKYSNKEQQVKLRPKEEKSKENLWVSIMCKYYNPELTVSTSTTSTGIIDRGSKFDVFDYITKCADTEITIGKNSESCSTQGVKVRRI